MKFQDRVLLFAFWTLRFFVRMLPLRLSFRLARAVGAGTARFFPRELRIAEAQMDLVRRSESTRDVRSPPSDPALAQHDALFPPPRLGEITDFSKLSRELFGHIWQSAAESMRLQELLKTVPQTSLYQYVDSTGQELVADIMRDGKGAITLSGHLGCFELLAAFHVHWGANVSVIGRDPNYPAVSRFVRTLRKSYGIGTIWRDEPAAAKEWMAALRKGRVVATLIDQDIDLENAFCPFFRLPVAYPITPIKMAIKRKIPLMSSFIVRTGELKHHVITARLEYDPDDPHSAEKVLATFNGRLEDLIRRFPEQWIWWHRRWRRRPGIDYLRHPELLRSTDAYCTWLNNDAEHELQPKQQNTSNDQR